jgi:hypothetical protein
LAPPRIAESVRLGLMDGNPTATSPYLYIAPDGGSSIRSGVLPLAILIEPCAAWHGTARYAAQLVNTAYRCMVTMHAANVPAQLQALFEQLNTEGRLCTQARRAPRSGAQPPGFGIACLALAGSDLFIAQLPPGQLLIRQGAHVYAFPPGIDDRDAVTASDAQDPEPLGRNSQPTPRLLHTRIAAGDVIMLASSTMLRAVPRATRELSLESLDATLTVIGAAADRVRLRDGVVGLIRVS